MTIIQVSTCRAVSCPSLISIQYIIIFILVVGFMWFTYIIQDLGRLDNRPNNPTSNNWQTQDSKTLPPCISQKTLGYARQQTSHKMSYCDTLEVYSSLTQNALPFWTTIHVLAEQSRCLFLSTINTSACDHSGKPRPGKLGSSNEMLLPRRDTCSSTHISLAKTSCIVIPNSRKKSATLLHG